MLVVFDPAEVNAPAIPFGERSLPMLSARNFIGGLRAGNRGLYVSTGGLTKEARYEADRANVSVRLLGLDAFVRHYVDAYDKADDDTRSISRSPESGGRRKGGAGCQ